MRALRGVGYAERLHEQFRWTDLIGAAMRSAILWNKDLQSYSTILCDEETAEAEQGVANHAGHRAANLLSTRPVNFIAFAKTLSLSWRSGQWHPFKADAPVAQQRVVQPRRPHHQVRRRTALSICTERTPAHDASA